MPISLRETVTDPETGNSRTGDLFDVQLAAQTLQSSSVQESTATVEGELTIFVDEAFSASEADVLFEWAESGSLDSNPNEVSAGTLDGPDTFSTQISGLNAQTDYEFRAVVQVENEEAKGSTASFTTGILGVQTNSADSITTSAVTLKGEVAEFSGLSATDADASFDYRETGESTFNTIGASTVSAKGDSFSASISGLSSGTEYEFRAVLDADGEIDEGSLVTVNTNEVVVTTDSARNVEAESAEIVGDISTLSGVSTVDYRFDWGKQGNVVNSTTTQTTSTTGEVSETVSNLDAGTIYEYELIAETQNDTFTDGVVQFETDDVAIGTGTATSSSSGSATLNGTVGAVASGISSVDVSFEYRETGSGSFTTLDAGTESGLTSFSASISPGTLSENTEYEFKAVGKANSQTFEGSTKTFTTLDEEVVIENATESSVGAEEVTLNADVTTFDNVESAQSFFDYGLQSGTLTDNQTTKETLSGTGTFSEVVSGLAPGEDYEFRPSVETDQETYQGSVVSFSTDALAVSTDPATSVGTGTAGLNGTLDALASGGDADVGFEYGVQGNNLPNSTTTQNLGSAGSFSENLSSLDPGATYEFRATGTENVSGDTDEGTVETFTTDDLSASTIGTTSTESDSITFEGSLDINESGNSVDLSFEYQETGQSGFNNSVSTGSQSTTGSFTAQATGLSPDTEYEFRAVAEQDTARVEGGTQTATTDTAITVSTVGSNDVEGTQVQLEGSVDALASGGDADVGFNWGTTGNVDGNTLNATTLSSPGNFFGNLTGLSVSTDYEFKAFGTTTGSNITDEGQVLSFTTKALQVSTDSPINVDVGSAQLEGTLDALDSNETEADVDFEWGAGSTESDLVNTIDAGQGTMTSAGNFNLFLNLNKDTDYIYRAVGTASDSGDVVKGQLVEFTTDNIEVGNLSLTSVTTTKIDAEFDITTFTGDNDITVGVDYVLSSDGDFANSTRVEDADNPATGTGTFTVTVDSLSDDTSYDFRGFAEVAGVRVETSVDSFTT